MQADLTPTEENARSGGSAHQAVDEPPKDEAKPEKPPAAAAAKAFDPPVEEPDEAEALGAEIMAVIEGRVSEDEAKRSRAADAHSSEGIAAFAARDHNADDRQSNAVQESAPEKTGNLTSDAPTETILLEPADEVQISAAKAPGKANGKIKVEAAKPKTAVKAISDAAAESANRPPDILKTENAASKTAAGIKKQKEKSAAVDSSKDEKTETAKSQALKRQKAALAKAKAQKKQQLLLAKAAALKQKKATEAKARLQITRELPRPAKRRLKLKMRRPPPGRKAPRPPLPMTWKQVQSCRTCLKNTRVRRLVSITTIRLRSGRRCWKKPTASISVCL